MGAKGLNRKWVRKGLNITWAEGVKYPGGGELKYEVGEKGLNISPEEVCGTLRGRKGLDIKRLNTKRGRLDGGGKG